MSKFNVYTNKQKEVLKCSIKESPKILLCSGAKRAGKTFILIQAFIDHMTDFIGMGVSFIIGGATSSTIQRNILDDMEQLLGIDIKLNKNGGFELWGNMVYCFGGANSDSWKAARGFTAAGAFLNEGTALHDTFVKEVISRCSFKGARIFIDTNPENPMHPVKTDYIDKDGQKLNDGRLNIKAFHFTLYDNDKLPADYIESIEKSTPSGMFFDRDILGRWVAAEGVVYKDFNEKIHMINEMPRTDFVERYIGGIDYGFEHHGSIVVIAKTVNGNYYLVEEIAEQHRYIEWWTDKALELQDKYPYISFYADHARPEYVQQMMDGGVNIYYANKSVVEGINKIGSLLKQDKLFFLEDIFKKGKQEMFLYVWSPKKASGNEEVVKTNDDVLDAVRYAIFTDFTLYNGGTNTVY